MSKSIKLYPIERINKANYFRIKRPSCQVVGLIKLIDNEQELLTYFYVFTRKIN
jgi:hypothetical protein